MDEKNCIAFRKSTDKETASKPKTELSCAQLLDFPKNKVLVKKII
jgi:hypothetical protein